MPIAAAPSSAKLAAITSPQKTTAAAPPSPKRVVVELTKQTKCRCGLTFQQDKKSLSVSAVAAGSIAAESGFLVGDTLLSIDGVQIKEDLRFSKHKAAGLLFDVKGTCKVLVLRGGAAGAAAAAAGAAGAAAAAADSSAKGQAPSEAAMKPRAASVDEDLTGRLSTASSSVSSEAPTGQQPVSVAEAVAIAEAKVAAAMARAAAEARAKAATKAAEEAKLAEEARVVAAAAAARAAKASEEAAAKRRAAAEAAEAERSAAAMAAKYSGKSGQQQASELDAALNELDATISEIESSTSASSAPTFAKGDAVLYDNQRTGQLQSATVTCVHTEIVPAYYTISCADGAERQTEGNRLTLCRQQPKAAAASSIAAIPAFKHKSKPRLGQGNPKLLSVPGLPLRAHGIGVSPKVKVPVRAAGGGGNAFGWKPYM